MTAAVIAMPFALSPVAWARVLFFATGAGLLAWTFNSEPHRRWVFFSGSFLDAFALAQWSPFITGCIELPAFLAGAVLTAKPTAGLALAVAFFLPITRRTWWALAGALTTVVISLILTPSWPINFIAATRNSPHIVAPVTLLPLGPIILLVTSHQLDPLFLTSLIHPPETDTDYRKLFVMLLGCDAIDQACSGVSLWTGPLIRAWLRSGCAVAAQRNTAVGFHSILRGDRLGTLAARVRPLGR